MCSSITPDLGYDRPAFGWPELKMNSGMNSRSIGEVSLSNRLITKRAMTGKLGNRIPHM